MNLKKLFSAIFAVMIIANVSIPAGAFSNNSLNNTLYQGKTKDEFSIGCDHEAVLYGGECIEYGKTKYCIDEGCLYSCDGDKRSPISERYCKNLNECNGLLYFTTFNDGISQINTFDPISKKTKPVLTVGSFEIVNFYIINNKKMMYLTNGIVYECDLVSKSIKQVSTFENVFSFIPTRIGIIYANGELLDYSLFLNNFHLLDNANYYSIREDHLVVQIEDTLYQISLDDLYSYCNNNTLAESKGGNSIIPLLEDYNLYGIYDVAELLQLNNANRECETCDSGDCFDDQAVDTVNEQKMRSTNSLKPPTNVGQMILSQSATLTGHTWTALSSIKKYNSNNYFSGSQTGIPYARNSIFNGTDFDGKVSRIIFDSDAYPDDGNGEDICLDCFDQRVGSLSSMIYGAASQIAPLYGMDCSAFLSYCWGIKSHIGSSNLTGSNYCTQLSIANQNSLGLLEIEDALIDEGSHCLFVSRITLNSSGTVTEIQITDEYPPKTRTKTYTASAFCSKYFPDYGVYRCKSYKVTFNGNGGTPSTSFFLAVKNIPYGYGFGLPTATRSGFTFVGWFTQPTGGTLITSSSHNNGAAITLYAHWIEQTPLNKIVHEQLFLK